MNVITNDCAFATNKSYWVTIKTGKFYQDPKKTELSRRIGATWRVFFGGALAGA